MVDFIQQNLTFFVFMVGIFWGILLDGLLVERGKGYIKINFIEKSWRFQDDKKGYLFFIIEVIIITIGLSLLSNKIIPSLITNYGIWVVIVSLIGSYLKFHKEVYRTYI